ncbi:MAG: hypothetical protein ETSY1_02335 [Candidatus Entotheonella factor]|uniref:Type I restriction enzyme R protein N-terminal domain-containing protein n=1 Tax=Entotheonella factor TaxID=1429438 RepID=W4LXL1_ENTF1|nr:hypothetical protein [Candidatus Entotheonella palauensis]ETX02804.1 MAG: hypothetical protein ETSY1_02335 [Candidatus Entotheonella factor]
MTYSDFTLSQLKRDFQLTIYERIKLFTDITSVEISDFLSEFLSDNIPLALAINTEKARSEMIITPILIELRKIVNREISLFSGTDFTVDPTQGLNGICDFIIGKSEGQFFLDTPVLIIVEAKNESIKNGLPQCIAAMVAAQIFNHQENTSVSNVYGAVTTGDHWKFLKLEDKSAFIDLDDYYTNDPGKIIGILLSMVENV